MRLMMTPEPVSTPEVAAPGVASVLPPGESSGLPALLFRGRIGTGLGRGASIGLGPGLAAASLTSADDARSAGTEDCGGIDAACSSGSSLSLAPAEAKAVLGGWRDDGRGTALAILGAFKLLPTLGGAPPGGPSDEGNGMPEGRRSAPGGAFDDGRGTALPGVDSAALVEALSSLILLTAESLAIQHFADRSEKRRARFRQQYDG